MSLSSYCDLTFEGSLEKMACGDELCAIYRISCLTIAHPAVFSIAEYSSTSNDAQKMQFCNAAEFQWQL